MAKSGLLVLNAGSSSLKFAVFGMDDDGGNALPRLLHGQIAGIDSTPMLRASRVTPDGREQREEAKAEDIDNHQDAIAFALDWIRHQIVDVSLAGAGHRVVHGGRGRRHPALITAELLEEIDALCPLAPHHQPHNLAAIRALQAVAPQLPQVACFDTAFHAGQPEVARRLPLPACLRDKGLQRYGFHGLSYEYIVDALAARHGGAVPGRLIVAHLGNGASVCAVRDGRSVATSMGFSTLDGLLMGTRCGTLDPGVLLHLMREERMGEPELSDLLYNDSGLRGISGISADMRVLLASDDPAAADAVDSFCYTLVRTIGSMAAALEGVDALVFTGGIGEHAAQVRAQICRRLAWLGVDFDEAANAAGDAMLTSPHSRAAVWVVPTNEELVIARHTRRLVDTGPS